MRSTLADIDVELLHTTAKAWLVKSVDTGVQAWVAFQMGELELKAGSSFGTLTCEQGILEEKRLV